MSDPLALSAAELRAAYAARELSPVEVVDAVAARLDEVEPVVNAFTTLALDRAREEAEAAERRLAAGAASRPLEGIPLAVKDLYDTEGIRTTRGSAIFADHVPAADAAAVARARAAGAIVVGKTATHEFGWGITTDGVQFGPTRNPWDPERVAGGSSGGSAAALATGIVPLALGSDTGGSIRIPAAFCGVVGLKPTYGRVSAAGAFPLAPSLDHPGPMAGTPEDAALLLEVIAGRDPADAATEDVPLRLEPEEGVRGLRVAVCADLHTVPLAPDVERAFGAAVSALERLGADVVEASLPDAETIYPTFVTIQRAEAADVHRRAGLFPAERESYGADVRGRLELAQAVTLSDYLEAQAQRRRVRAAFADLFGAVDLLLTPVAASSPVRVGAEAVEHLGEPWPFRDVVMPYTVPQDLVGLPSCALRAGFDALGIPVGVQLTGPPWSEGRVLRAARAFHAATEDIQARRPERAAAVDA